jgi:hypothetical protein
MQNFFRQLVLATMVFSNVSCVAKQQSKSVEAILVETIPVKISCGNISYAMAFKFKLMSGDEAGKTVIGIVKCPDTYGKDVFVKDAKFKVELSNNMSGLNDCQIFNSYTGASLQTYFVSKIEKQ